MRSMLGRSRGSTGCTLKLAAVALDGFMNHSLDESFERDVGRRQGALGAGSGREVRVGVDLEDPRLARRVDAEIEAHEAAAPEQLPAGAHQPLELALELGGDVRRIDRRRAGELV